MTPELSIYLSIILGLTLAAICAANRLVTFEKIKKTPISFRAYIALYFLFLLFSLFSIFYSDSQSYGFSKQSLLLFFSTLFFLICLSAKNNSLSEYKLFVSFSSSVLAIYYIFLFSISGSSSERIGVAGSGSITIGRIFAFAFICCLYLQIETKNRKLIPLSVALLVATFLSGSRGNFISLLASLLIPLAINYKAASLKLAFLVAATTLIILNNYDISKIPFYYRYYLIFDGGGDSLAARLYSYQESISAFLTHPILGLGAGGFSSYALAQDVTYYPHSIFFESISEYGAIGSALLFSALIFGLKSISRTPFLLSVFVFYALSSLVSGDMFDSRLLLCAPLLLIPTIKNENKTNISHKTKQIPPMKSTL